MSGGHKRVGVKLGASEGDKLGWDVVYESGIFVGIDVGEVVGGGGARGQTACNGSFKSDYLVDGMKAIKTTTMSDQVRTDRYNLIPACDTQYAPGSSNQFDLRLLGLGIYRIPGQILLSKHS